MSRHQLAHTFDLLLPADLRKRDQALEGRKNGGPNAKRGCGAVYANIGGDLGKILRCARREAKLHSWKRRNAASTSASVANWRRLACARPSSTAGRCAASISSGSPS